MQGLKQEMSAVDAQLSVVEQECDTTSQSIQTLQSSQTGLSEQIIHLLLLLYDLENHSRRQNMRFRGILESIPLVELQANVMPMFSRYLDHPPDMEIVIDRVDPSFPAPMPDRDVFCRLYSYTLKEEVFQWAWLGI